MSLTINHNLMAMNTARNLSGHYASLATSTQRLSSGLRINKAADDAAGLAVRELMRSDIATLNQGVRNANDAISMIQTADGALQVIDEKLIRMKELAEQAATGTYTSTQRIIIDSEFQAMAAEINRISNATDFNGIYLLNGNLSSSVHNGSGSNPSGKLKVHFGVGNSSAEDYYYIQIGCCTSSALGLGGETATVVTPASGMTEAEYVATYGSSYTIVFNGGPLFVWLVGRNTPPDIEAQFDTNQIVTAYEINAVPEYKVFATDYSGNLHALKHNNSGYIDDEIIRTPGGNSVIQTSAVSVSTQTLAQQALDKINTAIISKDKIRANLGAIQNRLENTIFNLEIQAENLQAAESQISDVDVAEEMTSFVREQILTQAAVAMLSQANSLPKMALQLIQG